VFSDEKSHGDVNGGISRWASVGRLAAVISRIKRLCSHRRILAKVGVEGSNPFARSILAITG